MREYFKTYGNERLIGDNISRAASHAGNKNYDVMYDFLEQIMLPLVRHSECNDVSYIGVTNIWEKPFAFKVELQMEWCGFYYFFNLDKTVDIECPEGWSGREKSDMTWEQALASIIKRSSTDG